MAFLMMTKTSISFLNTAVNASSNNLEPRYSLDYVDKITRGINILLWQAADFGFEILAWRKHYSSGH